MKYGPNDIRLAQQHNLEWRFGAWENVFKSPVA